MTTAEKALAFVAATPGLHTLVRHDPGERQYELVHRDEDVEIYLICWMDGHDTGFHDHDDSAAAILVLDGEVTEERLSVASPIGERYTAGAVVEIPAHAIHRVRHSGTEPSVTIHAYSPPLRRVGTYEVRADGALTRWPRDAETPLTATTVGHR